MEIYTATGCADCPRQLGPLLLGTGVVLVIALAAALLWHHRSPIVRVIARAVAGGAAFVVIVLTWAVPHYGIMRSGLADTYPTLAVGLGSAIYAAVFFLALVAVVRSRHR